MGLADEFPFPKDATELSRHPPVAVAMGLVTAKGNKLVLAGRTTTSALRPQGCILQVRPQLKRPYPVRQGMEVSLRLSKSAEQLPIEAPGVVAWVRDKAFMPSGLAVSMIGVMFSWDQDEIALELAAFLAG